MHDHSSNLITLDSACTCWENSSELFGSPPYICTLTNETYTPNRHERVKIYGEYQDYLTNFTSQVRFL